MKILGIGISFFVLLFIVPIQLKAQNCSLSCVDTHCGFLNVAFNPQGGPAFCEGDSITFTNVSDNGFDFFVFDWSDGSKKDTLYNKNPISHLYTVADSNLCDGDKPYMACFKGVKTCADGMSCASGSYDFLLKVRPKAILNLQSQYCIHLPVAFMSSSSCNVDSIYFWNFGDGNTSTLSNPTHTYSSPGLYNVSLTVSNDCGSDMTSTPILVVDDPVANVNWLPADDTVCINQIFSFTDITSTIGASTIWIFPLLDTNKWVFTDTLMNANSNFIEILFKEAGSYTMKLKATNACGDSTWMETIVVLDGPVINLNPAPEFCETNAIYTPFVFYDNQIQIQTYNWQFFGANPGNSNIAQPSNITYSTPGVFPVTLTITSECGNSVANIMVTVDSLPLIVMPSVPPFYCSGSSPDTLQALPIGGIWSGQGITSNGIFNPGSVPPGASYILTYTAENGQCEASSSVTAMVVSSESVTVQDEQYCEDALPFNLVASPQGGIWSGTGIINSSGVFDPDSSGVGIFSPVYHYMDLNGCAIEVSPFVVIQAFPVSVMLDTSILCNENVINSLAEVLQLSLTPPDGDTSWMINGLPSNGTINGMGLTGFFEVDLNYSFESCTISDSATIEFITSVPLLVSEDTTLCIYDNTFQLQSNLAGSWSGLGVNPISGIIDLGSAGAGILTYVFSHQPGTSCEQNDSVLVTINDPGISLDAGPDISLCFGEVTTYTFSGSNPTGGAWSGTGIIDSTLGILNVTPLISDSIYTYSYCLEDSTLAFCRACDVVTVIVHSLPDASFSITGTPCKDISFNVAVDSCDLQSSYAWDFGDGGQSIGCSVNHTYTMGGDYILRLTVTSQFGCRSISNQIIHVTAPPIASFNLVSHEGCAPFPIDIINMSSGEISQQLWLIGSDTILGANPGPIIIDGVTSDSIIQIELQISNGCATVIVKDSVLVHPYPVVDFGFNVDEGCSPLHIDFGNATLGNPETWNWDLGNGMMSTDSVPPAQNYTSPPDSISIYYVQLISTNACGSDTLIQSITVFPPDVTAFIQLDTITGCQPLTVPAHSISTPGSSIGWQVFHADTLVTGSSDIDPVFILTDSGVHMIILSAAHCGMDFDTAFVNVLPAPVVDFTLDPVLCQDAEISFQNLSQDITAILWDFGDGVTTSIFNPTHVYQIPGFYSVTLQANSIINNCPNSKTIPIEVLPKPQILINNQPKNGCPPFKVEFENSGPLDLTYVWSFGDGSSDEMTYAPSHIFTQSGTFVSKVFAYDPFGCVSDTILIPITIHELPVSQFDILTQRFCERYDTIFTQNNSSGASSYSWLVNGNSFSPDPLVFLPDSSGLYHVDLIAETSFGCRDTFSSDIEILPSPLGMFQIGKSEGCAPLTSDFINNSTGSTDYIWDFGDGNTSLDISPIHIFQDSGTYLVTLIAINTDGCPNDTITGTIQAFPVPTANFDFQKATVCGVPMDVSFFNLSTGGLDYGWTFGDGSGSDVLNPLHTYTNDGQYLVDLLVGNIYSCFDTASSLVEIYQQPLADFFIPGQIFCEEDPIQVINQSANANTYCWFLDDVLFSETTDPVLYFPEPGMYTLSLVAKYNAFCKDTYTLANRVEIFVKPNADFSYEVDQVENILGDVQFHNLSERFDRLLWDFGDGTSGSELDPFHEYDINRDIEVILYAYNDNGGVITCIDSATQNISPEWVVTFFVPNAFSPDYGDSLVRVFKPVGIGLLDYDISVFSPWGQRVWHSTAIEDQHPRDSWNGRLDNTGDELPQGSFTWMAKVEFVNGERRVYKGSVTLLR